MRVESRRPLALDSGKVNRCYHRLPKRLRRSLNCVLLPESTDLLQRTPPWYHGSVCREPRDMFVRRQGKDCRPATVRCSSKAQTSAHQPFARESLRRCKSNREYRPGKRDKEACTISARKA